MLSSGGRLCAADQRRCARRRRRWRCRRRTISTGSSSTTRTQAQNPDPIVFGRGGNPLTRSNTLRGGDTATGIVGVLTYTWAGNAASGNAYRVRPIDALGGGASFEPANPRPAAPPAVGGTLQVVGHEPVQLLQHLRRATRAPAASAAPRPTAAAPTREPSSTGSGRRPSRPSSAPTPTSSASSRSRTTATAPTARSPFLVDQLNAATAPGTYAFIDVDAGTGQVNALGTDAIKVGADLQAGRGRRRSARRRSLNSRRLRQRRRRRTAQPAGAGPGVPARTPPAQRFIVDVNHLKSKGSACDAPDAGDGQGNCNAVRDERGATLLADWLATDPTGTGDPDVLIVGDLNSYAKEDPITALEAAGYTNLVARSIGAGCLLVRLRRAVGLPRPRARHRRSLIGRSPASPTGTSTPTSRACSTTTPTSRRRASRPLYAPDQFRVSDHDPVIVGLTLNAPPTSTPAGRTRWPKAAR